MPRRTAVSAPKQTTCPCGSMVNLVPFAYDHDVMIPVDIDRDLDGGLVIVGTKAGYTVRLIRADEEPKARWRRAAHWDTCPHTGLWINARMAVGLVSVHDSSRSGPCARCGARHPWHYGGPIASPVCDRCREKDGMPIMGEYD